MEDLPARYRDRFPILGSSTYLVSHSLGAMPGAAADAMRQFTELWATRGVRAWAEGWWDMPRTVGDELAPIVGAQPGTVVMHQNVAVCQSLVLSSLLPAGPERNRIVLLGPEFPSVRYVYEAHARKHDLELVVVESRDGIGVDAADVAAAIDERTLLVPISHVLFATSYRMELEPIIARAREVGALVLLDLYQSAGTVPIDLTALDVDLACGGSVKWLCGGPGAGYLYVNPRLQPVLEPAVTGWAAHAEPFAFDPDLVYADGIARFQHGSPGVPALYAAREGYAVLREVGIDAVHSHSRTLTERIVRAADDVGIDLASPRDPDRRGGSVTLAVEGGGALVAALAERDILVDYRPGAGVRISPHFYTTADEVDAAMEQLVTLVRAGVGADGAVGAAY